VKRSAESLESLTQKLVLVVQIRQVSSVSRITPPNILEDAHTSTRGVIGHFHCLAITGACKIAAVVEHLQKLSLIAQRERGHSEGATEGHSRVKEKETENKERHTGERA